MGHSPHTHNDKGAQIRPQWHCAIIVYVSQFISSCLVRNPWALKKGPSQNLTLALPAWGPSSIICMAVRSPTIPFLLAALQEFLRMLGSMELSEAKPDVSEIQVSCCVITPMLAVRGTMLGVSGWRLERPDTFKSRSSIAKQVVHPLEVKGSQYPPDACSGQRPTQHVLSLETSSMLYTHKDFLPLSLFLHSVYLYTSQYLWVHCTHVCRGHRSMWDNFLSYFPHYLLGQALSMTLELAKWSY